MNTHDLLARIRAATIQWRADPYGQSSARAAHDRLISLAETGRSANRSVALETRLALLGEVRRLTLMWLTDAGRALEQLYQSRCKFVDISGDSHGVLLADVHPFMRATATAVAMAPSFAALDSAQQARILDCVRAESQLRNDRTLLEMEIATGRRPEEVTKLEMDIASSVSKLQLLKAQLRKKSVAWMVANREGLDLLAWAERPIPTFPAAGAGRDALLHAARTLDEIGDWLIRPLPLDPEAGRARLRYWTARWLVCEQAAEGLSVSATWLRALGSGDDYPRCELCYRHLAPGMKKNCKVHQRTSQVHVPSRERQLSGVYHSVVRSRIAEQSCVVNLLRAFESPLHLDQGTIALARQARVDPHLERDAAQLAKVLRTLYPVMSTNLRRRCAVEFQNLLRAAEEPFRRQPMPSDVPATIVDRRRSQRLLTWEHFFGQLFASRASSELASPIHARQYLDIDHPLASSHDLVSLQKVALDIIHMDSWSRTDMAFDKFAYLDLKKVSERRRQGATLKEIGDEYGVTAQAVEKALRATGTSRQRKRSLKTGMKALQRALHSQLGLPHPPRKTAAAEKRPHI